MLQYDSRLDEMDWYEQELQQEADRHFKDVQMIREELDEFEKELEQQYELTGEWNWDLDEKCDELKEILA